MSLTLQHLPKIKRQDKMRVGGGIGSGKGKTSGRGVKGQKARTGHHSVKGFEGGQTPVHMRLPKRGFVNNLAKKTESVNIARIFSLLNSGKMSSDQEINKQILKDFGLIKSTKSIVKLIMGSNNLNSDFIIKVLVDKYSENAKKYS